MPLRIREDIEADLANQVKRMRAVNETAQKNARLRAGGEDAALPTPGDEASTGFAALLGQPSNTS